MDDDSFSKKANISVITRFDPEVQDIVISASQVALYVFDEKKKTWSKRNVEGAFFFYKRKTSPKYGIFVLNRLDTTNFMELMNSKMEFQLQEPFILYRNIYKTIYGFWFYEKTECTAMASVLHRILKELREKEQDEQEGDSSDAMGVTVIRARDKSYPSISDQNDHESNGNPNAQPDSVRMFFAKASKEVTKPMAIPQPACSKSLCGSFQSVAHIEKAQKSDQLENSYSSVGNDFCLMNRKADLLRNDDPETNVSVIENNMRAAKLSSVEGKLIPFSPKTELNCSFSELPELIPPGMLLTADLASSLKADTSDVEKQVRGHILTKSQMIQAMEYLLKNDSQFTEKLYDAYLKSSRT